MRIRKRNESRYDWRFPDSQILLNRPKDKAISHCSWLPGFLISSPMPLSVIETILTSASHVY